MLGVTRGIHGIGAIAAYVERLVSAIGPVVRSSTT
jgi:hypothetical protein